MGSRGQAGTAVRGGGLGEVRRFRCLGSFVSAGCGIGKGVSAGVGLAARAFGGLRGMLRSLALTAGAGLGVCRSSVGTVLLCGAGTWGPAGVLKAGWGDLGEDV